MKKEALIITICTLLVTSIAISRDLNPVKAERHRVLREARTAYDSGQTLTEEQTTLLIQRGIIKSNNSELDEQGGPDEFGHYYIDSQEEGGPSFEWIDISETGNEIEGMGDDDYQGPLDLPFDFPFYGTDYDEIYICSNGYLTFGAGSEEYDPNWEGVEGEPNNVLLFCGTDLDPSNAGSIYYESHDDGYWICQFDGVSDYDWEGAITAEVLIYPNGLIYYQYESVSDVFYLVEYEYIGIENEDGSDYLHASVYEEPADYPFDELGILFTPGAPDASIRGIISDENTGDPIAAARVRFCNFAIETDEEGFYGIPDFFSGPYVLTVEALGYETYRDTELEVAEGGNTIEIELTPLATTIMGTVTDAITEEAIEDAEVTVYDSEGETVAEVVTDEGGQYLAEMNMGGQFDIEVTAENYHTGYAEDIELAQGEEAIQDFQLDPLITQIMGTVTDALTDEAIESAEITVYDSEGEIVAEVITDEGGMYLVEMDIGGLFDVEVTAENYRTGYAEDIELALGEEATQDFQLDPIFSGTIEELQTDMELGQWITTVGIVTQPTNSTNIEETDFYIQDGSGYGIRVWDDAPWTEDDLNRGDSVLVVGILDEANNITQIIDFELELLGTGLAMPDPLIAGTSDMAGNGAMEGSWVQTYGELSADPPDEGDFSLSLNDGSGMVSTFFFESTGIDLSDFQAGDWMVIRGVLSMTLLGVSIHPNMQEDVERVVFPVPADLAAESAELEEPLSLVVTLNWTHEMETDEFLYYKIYRDEVEVDTSLETTWIDTIADPNPGEDGNYTYSYTVSAFYDEKETDQSEPAEVIWDITSVGDVDLSLVPTEWALEAVYPNPFNPAVFITLAVPEAAKVSVVITDVLGRSVAELHNGVLSPARHRFSWNATNQPTGIYFLNLNSSTGFSDIRKLVFIK
ncbi:carboxypeptidase regulatory-like domain-containing protein [Calditrichota bacterium]